MRRGSRSLSALRQASPSPNARRPRAYPSATRRGCGARIRRGGPPARGGGRDSGGGGRGQGLERLVPGGGRGLPRTRRAAPHLAHLRGNGEGALRPTEFFPRAAGFIGAERGAVGLLGPRLARRA